MENKKKIFIEKFFDKKFNAQLLEMFDAKVWEITLVAVNRASQLARIAKRAEVSEADLQESFEDILTGEMLNCMANMSLEFDQEFQTHDNQLHSSQLAVPATTESGTLMPQTGVNSQTQPHELAQNIQVKNEMEPTSIIVPPSENETVNSSIQIFENDFDDDFGMTQVK